MKNKTKSMSSIVAIALAIIYLFAGNSCEQHEIYYEDTSGILSFRLQLADGRVFDCEVNQPDHLISNVKDSILFGTPSNTLSQITPIFTTTIGAKVYNNGTEIISGESTIDLSSPIKLETKYNSATRTYDLSALIEKNDYSETSGAKVNTDMTLTGLPPFNSYSAAWFNSKLYILGAYYPNATATTGVAYYELYSSQDGVEWTKVETNPNVIGGYGAELIVLQDKMFAIGGARLWGNDVNGTPREMSVSWKVHSTSNGVDWTDCTPGQVNAPSGRVFPQLTIHNNKIVLRRGKMFGFGMWQNINHADTYQTTDGTNWERVFATPTTGVQRNEDAMYSFNGNLYTAAGYVNWISEANQRADLWSSNDNGTTWVEENFVQDAQFKRYGHRVVSNGTKLYMIGGDRVTGSVREGVNIVMESANGVEWTPLPTSTQLPIAFGSRIYPNLIMGEDNKVWIIGGFPRSEGNYSITGLAMTPRYDVWTKKIN